MKADFGSDFYDVSSFEALAFGRYYFFNTSPSFSLFAQAGAGFVMLFEEDRMVPSVLGDGALGIRFPVKKFYTEQYIRFGWPAGFGFGLVVGYRFGPKPPPKPISKPVTVPEPVPGPIHEEAPAVIPNDLEIFFPTYAARFTEGGTAWLPLHNHNMVVLGTIADFLKDHAEYAVHITGHANPVLGTEEEAAEQLVPISLQRAEFVRDELVHFGVDAGRITVSGAGGADANHEDPQKNRRVEFRFEK